jgi:hypothetical protein
MEEYKYYTKAESLYRILRDDKPRLARFVLDISRTYTNELRLWLNKEKCHSYKHHEDNLNKALLLIEEIAEDKHNLTDSIEAARYAAWGLNCPEIDEKFIYKMNQCKPRSRAIAKVITHTLENLYDFTGPSRYKYKIIHLLHDVTHSWKPIAESMGELMYETTT